MKIGAHYVITEKGEIIKGGIIETANNLISKIFNMQDNIQELAQMEFHSGIICPDFTKIDIHSLNKNFIPSEITTHISLYNNRINNSIFEWMKAIQEKEISLNIADLVRIFSKLDNSIGIKINTKANIVLISNIDFKYLKLKKDSTIKNLI